MRKNKFIVIGPFGRKVGILASSFNELHEKCSAKFFDKNPKKFTILLEDDSEIDEEFYEVLEDNTVLKISTDTMKPHLVLFTRLEKILKQYCDIYLKAGDELDKLPESTLRQIVNETMNQYMPFSEKSSKSFLNEHPEWFIGLDTKFKTKESVMKNSAETRVRGYLQKVKKDLVSVDSEKYEYAIGYFQKNLKISRYNSSYFDRTDTDGKKLCSLEGEFTCYGKYNEDLCNHNHKINPYSSREERIVFSTWNFDHVIEKSRTIIPLLKSTLNDYPLEKVNLQYFHELLFDHMDASRKDFNGNLKLVHIVCHDKSPHSTGCNKRKLFTL